MQAIWLEDQTLSFREDVPIPVPGPGEALVKVRLAGICATDLELVSGYYPFKGILGHEFVGDVVAVQNNVSDEYSWVGKRVVGEIIISCGACDTCRDGQPSHCTRRSVLGINNHHGAFAEFLTLPLTNLHLVPDAVHDDAAVFTEPLAASLEIQQQVHVRPDDCVYVIGAGRLGQLIAQTLALTGCELFVVARHDYQRELLTSHDIPVLNENSLPERIADIVIEATGSEEGFALARRTVRPYGTIILKSNYVGSVQVDLSSIVVDEIKVVGSRCGPFPPALRLMRRGTINPAPLIVARYPLSEGILAFQHAGEPGALKVLLIP